MHSPAAEPGVRNPDLHNPKAVSYTHLDVYKRQVDLLPGTGGGLLSLAAFRALGLGLTDLPEVTIYAQ